MAPGVTSIFWLIQYSLPLSLGLLGALSFVRFRTPIKRAEDIAFILILIAGALACAVKQFLLAFLLLVLIFVYGLARNYLPGGKGRFAVATFSTKEPIDVGKLVYGIQQVSPKSSLLNTSSHDNITSVVFNIPRMESTLHKKLLKALRAFDESARVDVFYPDSQSGGY